MTKDFLSRNLDENLAHLSAFLGVTPAQAFALISRYEVQWDVRLAMDYFFMHPEEFS